MAPAPSGVRRRTAFADLEPYWTGSEIPAGLDPLAQQQDEDLEVLVPKTGRTTEWLGQVEDSNVLDKTDLYQENFIGTPLKDRMGRIIKPKKPGEPQKCEEFMSYPESGQPWWHPAFVFKYPVHSVRIRLTELQGEEPKKRWDVIFAGEPGGLNKVINAATPVGGKLPQFVPFCPPFKAKLKMELRLTDTDNKPPLFDERLTIVPKDSLPKKSNVRGKPRVVAHSRLQDGAVRSEDPMTDEDKIQMAASKDMFGNVSYFSMPPLVVAASLAGFL